MMSEWFLLLLPVAAASGWFSAMRGRQYKKSLSRLPSAYVKGLNQLLDQQHSKAVDTFIEIFQVNPDTVDTHIILGNLYRQRGEIEKAIKIHQNLIAKQNLTSAHRAHAVLELGRDCFDAGLLDRSEKLFKEVLFFKIDAMEIEVYQRLKTLYEAEKSWDEAILTARKLQKIDPNNDYASNIAHYYCELAETALADKDYAIAFKHLLSAEALDSALLRLDILRGDIYVQRNDFAKALYHYKRAFGKHPDFAILLLPRMQKTLKNMPPAEAASHIQNLKPSIVSVSYLQAYILTLLRAGLRNEVEQFFERLNENGDVPIPILKIVLQHKLELDEVSDKRLIQEVVTSLESNGDIGYKYQCSNCGFQSNENHWLCPSCMRWGMVMPRDIISTNLAGSSLSRI